MIELINVSFKYTDKLVIKDVSVKWGSGLHLIKGPNGSGKTTICKIISGLLPPDRGYVYIDGVDVYSGESSKILKDVVYVHDKPVILNRSVYDNLILGARLLKRNVNRLKNLVEFFGLYDILDINASELSAGYKQLISLSRAFIVRPRYLILDEPFTNLDTKFRDKVIEYIVKEYRENTVIVATHTTYLDRYADTIRKIHKGKLV